MRYLNLLLLGVIGAQALPTARLCTSVFNPALRKLTIDSGTAGSLLSREEADEDDNIVYA